MEDLFDLSIRRERLYKQVADQIQALIVADSLHPNDKLPSERDLAERLGISRTVVREAIRTLSVRGLVQVKPGCGTYVRELRPEDAMAPLKLLLKLRQTAGSLQNLYEVRRMLEVEIAGLAAERATEEDCAALQATIDGLVANADDLQEATQHDMAFHTKLADATHNELFSLMLSMTASLWLNAIRLSYEMPGAAQDGASHHTSILRQVMSRDLHGARQAMLAHIRHSQRMIEQASELADARDET